MVIMYGISYLNSDQAADFRWSETRLYMNLMMGAAMAIIMLMFMRDMYANKRLNWGIYSGSLFIFFLALALVRTQAPIHDIAYMRGMIPHHSIAILTSDHARISDKRVRELAERISTSQRREIKEMTWLVNDIKKNGLAATAEDANQRKVPNFGETSGSVSQR